MPAILDGAKLEALRAPFPDEAVGYKPVYTGEYELDVESGRSFIPESAFSQCGVCGKRHAMPARHLRYIGHARITERLNDVDPTWGWEPMAFTKEGLPLIQGGRLWIYLTVLGVTRIGVGDAGGRGGPDAEKEMIGDAIRNAAMRFGCGLDMWFDEASCEEEPQRLPPEDASDAAERPCRAPVAPAPASSVDQPDLVERSNATRAQRALRDEMLLAMEAGIDGNEIVRWISREYGRQYYEVNQREAADAIEYVRSLLLQNASDDDDGEEVITL